MSLSHSSTRLEHRSVPAKGRLLADVIILLQRICYSMLGIASLVVAAYMAIECLRIARYHSTEGIILASGIELYDTPRQPLSRPAVEFSYSVGGVNYTNDVYSALHANNVGKKSRAEAIARDFPVGKKCTVYFDAQQPQTSCLSNQFGWGRVAAAIFFAVFGSWSLWVGCLYKRNVA